MGNLPDLGQLGCSLEKWQTLIAGLIAIVAALIGGHFINRQIRVTKDLEATARSRRFDAAKAVLPLTLSSLTDYAIASNRMLKAIHATATHGSIPKQANPELAPIVPAEIVDDLRSLIELSDEPLRISVVDLMHQIQVQFSRVRSMVANLKDGYDDDFTITTLNVENYMIDTADIYARCSMLFDIARGNSAQPPGAPRQTDIRVALRQMGIWEDTYRRVHERLNTDYPL
jgi:hypothetical protein